MSEKLDREYIARQAEEIKALKEEKKDIIHQGLVWHQKYIALKDIRDELLEALKQYPEGELERIYIGTKFVHVSKIIQKAEESK